MKKVDSDNFKAITMLREEKPLRANVIDAKEPKTVKALVTSLYCFS